MFQIIIYDKNILLIIFYSDNLYYENLNAQLINESHFSILFLTLILFLSFLFIINPIFHIIKLLLYQENNLLLYFINFHIKS